ncbi:MAG: hypothetical protein ACOYOT_06160 [Bacteroidales bacterium]
MKKLIVIVAVLITGCKSPDLMMSPDLKDNSVGYDVKGRQGWQINQVISYGDYHSSKIKRGWESHFNVEFIARFKNASQKISFTQFGSSGSVDVLAVSKFTNNEVPLLGGYMSYSFNYKDAFAGTIISSNNNSSKSWDFIFYNMGEISSQGFLCGDVKQQPNGDEIQIRGISQSAGSSRWDMQKYAGFEFLYRGKSVGAVSLVNNGKVWFSNDLKDEEKLVLAAVSTALLARHDLNKDHSGSSSFFPSR